jgi:hypothetical protein
VTSPRMSARGMMPTKFCNLRGIPQKTCGVLNFKYIKLQIGDFSGKYKHQRVSPLLRLVATIYDRCLAQRDTQLQLPIRSSLVNTGCSWQWHELTWCPGQPNSSGVSGSIEQ